MFEVVNTTDRPITGQAIPSYGPQHAAQYFRKLDCFCFAKQTLQPGERREMPVVFVIDPNAPRRPRHDHAVVHVLRGRGRRQQIRHAERDAAHDDRTETDKPGIQEPPMSAATTPGPSRTTTSRSRRTGRSPARCALLLHGLGAAFWFNGYAPGPWMVAAGFARAALHAVRLVRHA